MPDSQRATQDTADANSQHVREDSGADGGPSAVDVR